jgi:cobalt/nickel transport protein
MIANAPKVNQPAGTGGLWLLLLAALAVAAFLSPLASPLPDGLERVAEDHGFTGQARTWLTTLFPDYTIPGLSHPGLTTALAGIAGTLLTFSAGWGLAALLNRRKQAAPGPKAS